VTLGRAGPQRELKLAQAAAGTSLAERLGEMRRVRWDLHAVSCRALAGGVAIPCKELLSFGVARMLMP
jgi:hypothetical protein